MHKLLNTDELKIYYTIPKKIVTTSMISNLFNSIYNRNEKPFDQISDKFYVGVLPKIPSFLDEKNIGMVVSVSTYEELADGVTPAQWADKNIQHILLHMPDGTSNVLTSDAVNALFKMQEFFEKNPTSSIYIHCMKGHSRSVMLLAAYLAVHDDNDLNRCIQLVKEQRSSTNVNRDKNLKGEEIIKLYKESKNIDPIPIERSNNVNEYLASLEAKNAFPQFTWFKELAIYAVKAYHHTETKIAEYIAELFSELLNSTDGKWYNKLHDKDFALQKFIDEATLTNETLFDKATREKLVESFIKDLNQHLTKLGYNVDVTPSIRYGNIG